MSCDEERDAALLRLCPDLFAGNGEQVLYVGASPARCDYIERLHAAGCAVYALEVWSDNLVSVSRKYPWLDGRFQRDVRSGSPFNVDWVFWWHGPEHVAAGELPATLALLESSARKGVVLGAPWGDVRQGEVDGNPHEAHLTPIERGFLEALGYVCEYHGRHGECGSSVVAVKRTNP